MEAAKQMRAKQLQRYNEYIEGQEVNFENHQYKEFKCTYDPNVYTNARTPVKLQFEQRAIFLHAAYEEDVDAMDRMVKEGMDPNVTNAEGLTALHTACIEGSLKVASSLVNLGANVNLKDDDWWTPLHAAAAFGHWRIVNFLLNHDADITAINADGDMPHDLAEDDRTLQVLEDALQEQKLDEDQLDALKGKPEADFQAYVDNLIATKADLNAPGDDGESPLHVAACHGWQGPLNTLIAAGADVNVQDKDGNTPLHVAIFFIQFKCVELLGQAGANLELTNKALQKAEVLTSDPAMLKLLKSLASKKRLSIAQIAPEELGERSNTIKRKSLKKGGTLAKMDREAEFKRAEVMYEEHEFTSRERRESEFDERDRQLTEQAMAEIAEETAKEEAEAKAKAEAEAKAKAEAESKAAATAAKAKPEAEARAQPDAAEPAAASPAKPANSGMPPPSSPAPRRPSSAKEVAAKASAAAVASPPAEANKDGGGCCIVQ
eukprot:m.34957 g.34957  ORF g.34957 m.34957 type:complete len:491 (+) comp12356_c0_seq1:170-1642(+)